MQKLNFKDFYTAEYKPGEDDLTNYRTYRRHRLGEDVEVDEALSVSQRLDRKRQMRKNKAKIELGRERAARRTAAPKVIEKRAIKQARAAVFKKITKDIPKGELTYQRRQEIEKRLEKPAFKQRIKMIARKLIPQVRKQEIERKRNQSQK